MFILPDLVQGSAATFDAQAVPDATDYAILGVGSEGFGAVAADTGRAAPVVTPCTATVVITSTTALSTLTGTQTVPLTGGSAGMPPSGFLTVPSTGGGTASIGYNGLSGGLQNCFYISGGSGNIAAASTATSIMAVAVSAGFVMNNYTPVTVAAQAISVQNVGGTAWQALPASTTDRKDWLVAATSGTLSIVQGTPCSVLDWTRNNGSYGIPPPVKATWSSSNPISLNEIYIPGVGSSHGTNGVLATGNLVDKSVPVAYPTITSTPNNTSGDTTIVSANTPVTCLTSASLPIGSYLAIGSIVIEALAATAQKVSAKITSGTVVVALGLYLGVASGEATLPAVIGECVIIPFAVSFSVTTAGTIIIQAQSNTGSSSSSVKNATPTASLGQCSGLQIIRTG